MGLVETEIIRDRKAPAVLPSYVGEIPTVSNEVELCLLGVDAPRVIDASPLEIDPEVNKRDIVELLVSMQPDADALNNHLGIYSAGLIQTVGKLGGSLYTGSSLLRDVSDVDPARYRTTSLSDQLARNLLDITSQQVVIGIGTEAGGEQFGIQLYGMLRRLTPVLLGMTASSPMRAEGGRLVDTGLQSRRVDQYRVGASYFPAEILEPPVFTDLDGYFHELQSISDEVNRRLHAGELDAHENELYRERDGGAYAPFDTLSPHQVYWMVRPRPDHANTDSVFSLEMRVMDTPIRLERMQAMNSFVLGLCYDAARLGFEDSDAVLSTIALDRAGEHVFEMLRGVGSCGLNSRIGRRGQEVREYVGTLLPYAIRGLESRGLRSQHVVHEVQQILTHGNDAEWIRDFGSDPTLSPAEMEQVFSESFTDSVLNYEQS